MYKYLTFRKVLKLELYDFSQIQGPNKKTHEANNQHVKLKSHLNITRNITINSFNSIIKSNKLNKIETKTILCSYLT